MLRCYQHLAFQFNHVLSKGISKLGIQKFEAKIGLDNTVSIAMFKKLHFQEASARAHARKHTHTHSHTRMAAIVEMITGLLNLRGKLYFCVEDTYMDVCSMQASTSVILSAVDHNVDSVGRN